VEAVACGQGGLLSGFRPGDVHVDLTTGSFARARWLAEQEAAAGVSYLDAPVSGGRVGVEQGSLSVMASGPRPALDRVRPVLEAFAGHIFYLGDQTGTGTLAKLVNNAIVLCSGLVTQEALALAAKAGLDAGTLLEVLESSSSAIYLGMARLTLAREFDDAFFTLALAEKDVSLALQSAADLKVEMGVTSAAHALYRRALEAGLGDKVFFATLKVVEEAAGTRVPRLAPRKA
jgi:3-hydroxyisobutyrate dehydrogenase-like beta-hydroxyacid dehydrogenase